MSSLRVLWTAAVCVVACQAGEEPSSGPTDPAPLDLPPPPGGAWTELPVPRGGNVLVIVLDDLGIDRLGAYGLGADLPPTPVLDGLLADGVLFRNAWGYPSCSPTRAALLTGRHGRRTGIGRWLAAFESWGL